MKPKNNFQYYIRLLVAMAIIITLAVTVIIYNNSLRSVPIFLFLLASGIAILAALGLRRGGIFGLFMVSTLIFAKQFIGDWSRDNLTFNLLEAFLLAGAFSLSGYYHDALRSYFNEFDEAKEKLKLLDLEDTSVGLIRPAVGLLRLKEESDRAIRFRRSISLVLIHASPKPGAEWDVSERPAVMRAVATTVKATTRMLDIPFSVNSEKIGLILTDTEINGINKAINNIQRQLIVCRIITHGISSDPLQFHAQIRFGYSVFLGHNSKPFDLMEAAELSLKRNVEMNVGEGFQNLFVDWEPIGEPPNINAILPAIEKEIPDTNDLGVSVFENNQQK